MRNDLPPGATRWRRRRSRRDRAGKIAFITGVAGPVLLIVAAIWAAVNAVRYVIIRNRAGEASARRRDRNKLRLAGEIFMRRDIEKAYSRNAFIAKQRRLAGASLFALMDRLTKFPGH